MAAPMLKMACTVSIVVRPAATHRAITEGAFRAIFRPGQRDKPESGDHGDHPDQAQFLPYQGEDHIRADLWHVGSLPARARAGTEEPPGLYGHHRLDHLVARAVRGGPGVEKRHEPLAPVGLEQHHPGHGHKSQEPRRAPGPAS